MTATRKISLADLAAGKAPVRKPSRVALMGKAEADAAAAAAKAAR